MNIFLLRIILNPIEQVSIIRPLINEIPEYIAVAEIRMELLIDDSEDTYKYEQIIFFNNTSTIRIELLQNLYLEEDCDENNCLVSLNNRILHSAGRRHDFPDGSVVRILLATRYEDDATEMQVTINQKDNQMQEDNISETF